MNHNASTDKSGFFAPEGLPIIAGFAIASALAGVAAVWFFGPAGYAVVGLGVFLTIWCCWFFRDPERNPPAKEGAVISPADGVVCMIDTAVPPEGLGISEPMPRVCVFMNVINVHVNRAPVAGTIIKIAYRAGKFFNAALDKASIHNERSAMSLRVADGRMVVVVQIAGLIARRIVSRVKEGGSLAIAQRDGLIRFGSRVDTYLPSGSQICVKVGDKSIAGETVIGILAPVSRPNAAPPAQPEEAHHGS